VRAKQFRKKNFARLSEAAGRANSGSSKPSTREIGVSNEARGGAPGLLRAYSPTAHQLSVTIGVAIVAEAQMSRRLAQPLDVGRHRLLGERGKRLIERHHLLALLA